VVSSLARAGRGATRARRRRGGIADSIFRDDDGDGWQDRRGAVAVGAAAGGQLWGRCRQHPAGTSAWNILSADSRSPILDFLSLGAAPRAITTRRHRRFLFTKFASPADRWRSAGELWGRIGRSPARQRLQINVLNRGMTRLAANQPLTVAALVLNAISIE
jgi:hypothetical protein